MRRRSLRRCRDARLVIVSRSRSFVFVHIPKNGGTAFRSMLAAYHDHPQEFWWVKPTDYLDMTLDHGHLRSWEVQMFYPDVWELMSRVRTLCFFRNPAERFVSAIYEHFRLFRQDVDLPGLAWPEQCRVAREFAETVTLRDALQNVFLIHFSPQTWFTHHHGEPVVNTVVPLIDGLDALRTAAVILQVADTGPSPRTAPQREPADLLGADFLPHLREMYSADYAFCDANDHLRPLSVP